MGDGVDYCFDCLDMASPSRHTTWNGNGVGVGDWYFDTDNYFLSVVAEQR
jgi:hypothetical protein